MSRQHWSGSASASRYSRSTGPARAKALRDYFEEASRNDYFLTYVIINPQAERAKDWGNQAEGLVAKIVDEDAGGITVRGAKLLGTSSIMANEVLVANLQPLKPGEEDLAFSCAVPMNIKGCACSRASPTRRTRCRCSTIRFRRASTRTTR
jgi:aromatic ring hydroxylase